MSGPAFPFPAYTYPNGEINHGEGGMTLRDYFAAAAMQGYIVGTEKPRAEVMARVAYEVADAMIKERK